MHRWSNTVHIALKLHFSLFNMSDELSHYWSFQFFCNDKQCFSKCLSGCLSIYLNTCIFIICIKIFFNVYLLLRERKRERQRDRVQAGEGHRERQTDFEPGLKHEIMTCTKVGHLINRATQAPLVRWIFRYIIDRTPGSKRCSLKFLIAIYVLPSWKCSVIYIPTNHVWGYPFLCTFSNSGYFESLIFFANRMGKNDDVLLFTMYCSWLQCDVLITGEGFFLIKWSKPISHQWEGMGYSVNYVGIVEYTFERVTTWQ